MNEFELLLGLDRIQDLNRKAVHDRKRQGKGCVLCNYTGYTTNSENKETMCSCEKNKFFYEIYNRANVPKAFIDKTLDDWNTRTDASGNDLGIQQVRSENVYTLLKNYDKHFVRICKGNPPNFKHSVNMIDKLSSLIFEGGIGSGKTFIASVMVQLAIKQNLTAKYFDWTELLETFIDFEKKEIANDIIDDFKNLDFIALDGVENLINHSQLSFHLERLARARLGSNKPTFIMAFGNVDQISNASGWRSLISNCVTIHLPTANKRG